MAKGAFASKEVRVLTFSVFIAGLCSIIYELLIATTSSYFLGDSITQFSLTIGIYMAAMGVGSYLSRLISDQHLLHRFIIAEIVLALLGGASVPLLYLAFAYTDFYQASALGLTFVIGCLIGLEIPLLSRLMEAHFKLKFNISNIMSVDYFGALLATLLFPFVLLPYMGIFRSSTFFGLANVTIAVVTLWCFAPAIGIKRSRILHVCWFGVALLLGILLLFADGFISRWSSNLYGDRIIYQTQTPYQNIVLTKYRDDIRLFLNGNLQFSAIDEYRYHESLVHIPMSYQPKAKQVLLLGAGDGLAVRELLKYSHIDKITLVDLDPKVTELASTNRFMSQLNQHSLRHDKVDIIHNDGFKFLHQGMSQEQSGDKAVKYDLIIADLPDPKTTALARFYSKEFYQLVKRRLQPKGVFVTQATSPIYATDAFWSIVHSMAAAGFNQVLPYHANVPSFGEWGFVAGIKHDGLQAPIQALIGDNHLKFLSTNSDDNKGLFNFAKDIAKREVKVSTLDQPVVMEYYLKGWRYWH